MRTIAEDVGFVGGVGGGVFFENNNALRTSNCNAATNLLLVGPRPNGFEMVDVSPTKPALAQQLHHHHQYRHQLPRNRPLSTYALNPPHTPQQSSDSSCCSLSFSSSSAGGGSSIGGSIGSISTWTPPQPQPAAVVVNATNRQQVVPSPLSLLDIRVVTYHDRAVRIPAAANKHHHEAAGAGSRDGSKEHPATATNKENRNSASSFRTAASSRRAPCDDFEEERRAQPQPPPHSASQRPGGSSALAASSSNSSNNNNNTNSFYRSLLEDFHRQLEIASNQRVLYNQKRTFVLLEETSEVVFDSRIVEEWYRRAEREEQEEEEESAAAAGVAFTTSSARQVSRTITKKLVELLSTPAEKVQFALAKVEPWKHSQPLNCFDNVLSYCRVYHPRYEPVYVYACYDRGGSEKRYFELEPRALVRDRTTGKIKDITPSDEVLLGKPTLTRVCYVQHSMLTRTIVSGGGGDYGAGVPAPPSSRHSGRNGNYHNVHLHQHHWQQHQPQQQRVQYGFLVVKDFRTEGSDE